MIDYQSSSIVAKRLLDHFKSTFLAGLATGNNGCIGSRSLRAADWRKAANPSLQAWLTLRRTVYIRKTPWRTTLGHTRLEEVLHQFRTALMHPWPDDEIDRAGYRVDLSHRSRSSVNNEYTLMPKQKLARQGSTEREERRTSDSFGA